MNKAKGIPPLVRFGLLLVGTVVVWLLFDTYRGFSVELAPPVPPEILEPLTPQLDSNALDELQRRINLGEGEIGDTVIAVPSDEALVILEEEFSAPTQEIEATTGGQINEQ